MIIILKPGFHKANFGYNNDQFWVITKRLVGRMTAQPHNRFVFCVVVVEFAVNGNQALSFVDTNRSQKRVPLCNQLSKKGLQLQIMQAAQYGIFSGHLGVTKDYEVVRQRFHWYKVTP